MTSMMPSQQRFGAPNNNNPGQPARPRPQVGGDMQFAGGSPYFDERTGQARQPARQSGGMDMSAYRPGQAQSQQPSFGSDYNPNANMRLPGNFGQPPQQTAGRQPASFGDMQFAGGTPYFYERTGQTRQPPFQMAPAQTPWGQSMDPFAERDAFVNQINQQRMQNQIAFNSGGPTNPAAGMNPGIDYQRAMQQAGLGGGAPSMAPDYGDSLIGRLNQQFGGSAYQPPGNFGGFEAGMMQQLAPSRPQQAPPAYFPGFDPQTQNQFGQPMQTQPFPAGPAFSPQPAPGFGFNEGYGFGGPSLPQPGYGTPPERRGPDWGRTADWRDRDGDGVDDRDQDGPGMPAYGRTTQRPSATPTIANDGKNPNRYDSGYPVGSEEWWQEASARNRAAAAAERPVNRPPEPRAVSQPTPPQPSTRFTGYQNAIPPGPLPVDHRGAHSPPSVERPWWEHPAAGRTKAQTTPGSSFHWDYPSPWNASAAPATPQPAPRPSPPAPSPSASAPRPSSPTRSDRLSSALAAARQAVQRGAAPPSRPWQARMG